MKRGKNISQVPVRERLYFSVVTQLWLTGQNKDFWPLSGYENFKLNYDVSSVIHGRDCSMKTTNTFLHLQP